jgi:Ca2+-binding RTX toxin-like protein
MSRNQKSGRLGQRQQSRRLLFENMESRLLMASSQSSLFDRVEQHLDNAPGVAGVAIVNLTTGEDVLINADTEFSTSSTIKAGILYAVLRKIDSDPAVTYDTLINSGSSFGSNQGDPANPIPDLQANTDYTITALASTMIANSNNWATNRLIQYLGMDYINEQFADLGLTHTEVNRYMVGSGSPSAHGNSGPTSDYREGFDNRSTPREFATMLQLIHENDGLLTNTSQQLYWTLMGQDGDLGTNTKGYTNDFYNSGVLGGWSSFIDQDNKAGSNTWSGDPGTFEFDDDLGTHYHRSEAGRFIFSNTGEVVFYTAFVNFAPNELGSEDAIQQIGYEIAAEFAEAPVTYTPSAVQLDDGRVLTVRGTAGADNIDLEDAPNDIDNIDIRVNGAFIASVDFEQDNGTDLVNRVYVYGRNGADDVDMDALPISIPILLSGEGGNDNLNAGSAATLAGGAGDDTLVGSNQNDFLTGDSGNDTVSGLGGNDILSGGFDHDTLSGGDGNDIVTGFLGNDSLQGGTGNDTLNGGTGNDTLNGNDGDDTLYGEAGDDTLTGWNGDDTLWGGADDDTLSGSSGEDVLRGEAGLDLLIGGADSDTLYGGDDADHLIGGYQTALVELNWDQSGDVLDGGNGNDAIMGDNGQFLPLTFGATGGNDTIRGGAGNDLVFGQGGNDHIQGHVGNDSIYSGEGNDTVFGGIFYAIIGQPIVFADGSDFVDAGAGNDAVYGDNWQLGFPPTISFGGAGDTLRGNSGDDVIYGQTGNDDLQGGLGNDVLLAGAGDDVADGNGGNDTVRGDVGHDRVVGSEGSDSVYGDVGNDVVVGGRFFATPNNTPDASDDLVEGGDGNDFLFGDSAHLPLALATNVGGNDTLRGGNGDDIMYGQVGSDQLEGGTGNDNLIGGDGNDRLSGGTENDVLSGQAGNDLLRGGDDTDTLSGGDGNDIVLGEAGNDLLSGNLGRDLLIGGAGRDYLSGHGDDDVLIGGRTRHDANDLALRAILAEWTSARTYSQRVANLRGTPNPQLANRLNGNSFLVSGATVFDDGVADSLSGGTAADWFFADPLDVVSDAVAGEQID